MKKLKLFFACLLMAVLSIGQVWADEGDTHAISSSNNSSFPQQAGLNNNATISSASITGLGYTVKKVELSVRTNKTGSNVDIEVVVGETSLGTQNKSGNNTATLTFQTDPVSSLSGDITINFTNKSGTGTGLGSIWLNTVTLTEGASAGGDPVDPTITFNNGSVDAGYTLDLSTLFTSNSNGEVTYSITAGSTYASIDGSVLTGVLPGSVTVQASQAATASYNAATANSTITVNEHVVTPGQYGILLANAFWGTSGTGANAGHTASGIQNDIAVSISGNSGTQNYINNTETRIYGSHTLTFSVPTGYVLREITGLGTSSYSSISVAPGSTGSITSRVWSGTANSVTFNIGGRTDFTTVSVTFALASSSPEVSVSPELWDFGTVHAGDAASKVFSVSGSNLTAGDLTLTAPAGFSVSPSSIAVDGTLEATEVTVSKNTSTVNDYSGNLEITGGGLASAKTVALTMSVDADPAPTGTFKKFTGDLTAGKYVICDGTNAMKNTATSAPRIEAATVTVNAEDKIVNPDANVVWNVEFLTGDDAAYFTLYNEDASKYAAFTSTNARGTVVDAVTDYAKWQYSEKEFSNKGLSGKYLRFNDGYGFASYATTTGNELTLYKLDDGTPNPPTFSPAGGLFLEAQSVTLSAEAGAEIYYTMGENPADPTSGSTHYTGAIAVSSTTTIKAIAIKDEKSSGVATATYTIVATGHAGTESDPYSVADAKIVIDAISTKENVYVSGIVSSIYSTSLEEGAISFYISDDGATTGQQFEAYKCKALNGEAFNDLSDVKTGATVVITGNLKKHNSIYELDADCHLVSYVAPTAPSISADPETVTNVAMEGVTNQTINLTYYNIENYLAEVTVHPNEDGTGTLSPAWLTASVSDVNNYATITYSVTANEGEARTAYMKVYALGDNDKDATIIIPVSQARYSVDYATLPFSFDGGSADIENKDGMTQDGLGSDYGSSPKLKFDDTDDWVIIKINETPGALTYDIKGNTFSDGTFKVQESEDGVDYTDVATYTELGATQHKSYDLDQDTRYVKFIYTEKVNGNVALGNIAIAEYVAPAAVETPEISGDESFLNSTTVTLSCETAGATIYYTIDGKDPKESATTGTSFTLTESATVRAIAKLGDDWSNEATSKTFTKITPYTTIAELAEAMTKTATPVYIELGNWQVSVKTDNRAFVTDGENGLIIYESGHGLVEGDVLSGTIQCNLVAYNGVVELTGVKKDVTSGLTVTAGTINPVVKTIVEANALGLINTGLLVKLENVTYNGSEFEDDNNNTIAPYTTFYDYSSDLESGKKYDITGIIQLYNSTVQIYPRKQSDIKEVVDPSAPETPTFSPAGGEYTEAQSVTITCETDGATIYYTTDGSAPDNTKTQYTGAISVSESMTIKAIAIKDNKSSAVAIATYTINIPEPEDDVTGTWTLVTDASKLIAGKKVIIASVPDEVAAVTMSMTQASNNRAGLAGATVSEGVISAVNGTAVFTIAAGTEENTIAFKSSANEYLYAASSEKNYIRSQATNDANGSWTVTIDEGVATIVAQGENTHNVMRYNPNNNSPIFACYGSTSSTGTLITLYMLQEDTPEPDYTRNDSWIVAGELGTVCISHGVKSVTGAHIYKLAGKDASGSVVFTEVTTMEPGKPYLFEATDTHVEFFYSDEEEAGSAGDHNGMYGTFSDLNITDDLANTYYFAGHALWSAVDLTGPEGLFVAANRAYIKLNDVPGYNPANQAPGRRYITLNVHGENAATGLDDVQGDNVQSTKVLINGNLYILRGEKVYDATGRLVK